MTSIEKADNAIHVAILGTLPPLRGLSSYCRELALALSERGPVTFISFRHLYPKALYPGGKLEEDHSFAPLNRGALKIQRRLSWYSPLSWVREGLATDADLLHAQWWSLPLAPIYATVGAGFKARRKPILFTVHNVQPHEASRIYPAACRGLFRLGDHFIVHTERNRSQLMEIYRIPEARISVIPHGLLGFQVRPGIDRERLRNDFGLTPKQRALLLFGNIRPYKGVETALEAFARISQEAPEARLIIAGQPWGEESALRRRIERLGIASQVILHMKYIPSCDVHRFFETADLVLLPYHHFDSQSGVGATAVAFEKPLIVSQVGGLPSFIRDLRWVVPPADPMALAGAIRSVLREPRALETMAEDSRAIAARLSWTAIADRTRAVYRQVLAESTGCGR